MKTALAEPEIDLYRENGLFVAYNFAVDGELAVWRKAVDDFVSNQVGRSASQNQNKENY